MRSFDICCRRLAILLVFFAFSTLVFSTLALASDTPLPKLSPKTRQEIIHGFNAELVYIRTNFPMGKTGLRIRNGNVTPTGPELQQLISVSGPAAKPGERARISNIVIKENYIRFEINGGPIKKEKWYQRIEINGTAPPTDVSDGSYTGRGSYVDLCFDKYVPEMTGPELKSLLRPVFDFDAKSPVEAYLETVSPKVKEAIQNHHVLVGMSHEMVIYAKGRPPRKVREVANEVEYEEWIYGEPPQDVDFVRFVGDEVVRVETMKVDGQKIVRVDKEVDVGADTVAKKQEGRPANAPTLRRPGDEPPPGADPTSAPPASPPQLTGGNSTYFKWSPSSAPAAGPSS
jgi:hypothetical protein